MTQADPLDSASAEKPDLSVVVVVPAHSNDPDALLEALERQTLAPRLFEVLLVRYGDAAQPGVSSPEVCQTTSALARTSTLPGATNEANDHEFCLRTFDLPGGGPWPARNLAVQKARAPLILFLDEAARPPATLLEGHLEAHERQPARTAILGQPTLATGAADPAFAELASRLHLLFEPERMVDRTVHGWDAFSTTNFSLPSAALLASGGFDIAHFPADVGADLELGWRLTERGWRVLYRADLQCEHHLDANLDDWLAKQVRLGQACARMWRKHRQNSILWFTRGQTPSPALLLTARKEIEAFHPQLQKVRETLRSWKALGNESGDQSNNQLPAETHTFEALRPLRSRLQNIGLLSGLVLELERDNPLAALDRAPRMDVLTSIVVVARDQGSQIEAFLSSLRSSLPKGAPVEILWVDDASTDGSAHLLAQVPDIALLTNARALGLAASWNHALALARGDRLAILDVRSRPQTGWLERLARHGDVDGSSGVIAAMDESSAASPSDAPQTFAQRAQGFHQRYELARQVQSPMVLVQRSVIERIGGFDPELAAGFEMEDFSLRASLAGFRNRRALDVDACALPKAAAPASQTERAWSEFVRKWAGSAPIPVCDWNSLEFSLVRPWSSHSLFAPIPALATRPKEQRA